MTSTTNFSNVFMAYIEKQYMEEEKRKSNSKQMEMEEETKLFNKLIVSFEKHYPSIPVDKSFGGDDIYTMVLDVAYNANVIDRFIKYLNEKIPHFNCTNVLEDPKNDVPFSKIFDYNIYSAMNNNCWNRFECDKDSTIFTIKLK